MAERLLDIIDEYSPNYRRAIIDYKLVTPLDIERDRLLTGGDIHHADVIPSQMLSNRPIAELSQYRAPNKGPLPLRRGHASVGRGERRTRPQRRARNLEGF